MVKNNLRQVIDNEGISQAEVARVSGFSTNTINKIYNKKTNGAPRTQVKVVEAVNQISGQTYDIRVIFPRYRVSD